MTSDKILNEFQALPVESQKQVADFIAFLQQRHPRVKPRSAKAKTELREEAFVGMWADRDDMADSVAYVKNLRATEWARRRG